MKCFCSIIWLFYTWLHQSIHLILCKPLYPCAAPFHASFFTIYFHSHQYLLKVTTKVKRFLFYIIWLFYTWLHFCVANKHKCIISRNESYIILVIIVSHMLCPCKIIFLLLFYLVFLFWLSSFMNFTIVRLILKTGSQASVDIPMGQNDFINVKLLWYVFLF